MPAYLTVSQFATRSIMPDADVLALDAARPGFLDSRLTERSAEIDARLSKRYATPFEIPAPEMVNLWLTRLVTMDAYMSRGFNPSSGEDSQIQAEHDLTLSEIKEAADAKDGLYDLPLHQDLPGTGIALGGPIGCSQASPYTAGDIKRYDGRNEDGSGWWWPQ